MAEIYLPALGADMTEATLLTWHIAIGDRVHRGDIIATVDTAKSALDIEALQDGVVESLDVSPGTTVPVGAVLGSLATIPSSLALGSTAHEPTRMPSSPLARRRAAELGVDLSEVKPSAPSGIIGLADVERTQGQGQARSNATLVSVEPRSTSAGTREVIAALMTRSKREIPHFTLQSTIDVEACLRRLEERNARVPLAERILPAAVMLRAVAQAATVIPQVNGHYDQGFRPASGVHLGMAISLRESGVVAPAILDADQLDLPTLMQRMKDLVRRARAGRLRASELSESTLTATILGDEGVDVVNGIIFPPQVALVGFGRMAPRPWAVDGMLAVHRVVTMTLAADHRVIDGHVGSRFLRAIEDAFDDWTDP